MRHIFLKLVSHKWFRGLNKEQFAIKAAHFLAGINAVHPFRDGNGRTQMTFMVLLAENAGFAFDGTKLEKNEVLDAMINSFRGNETALVGLLGKVVV